MLTKKQRNNMQKKAVKLCYGFNRHYDEILSTHGIRTLEQRRELTIRKFVLRTLENEKFTERRFVRRLNIETNIRRKRPYIVNHATTNRYKNSPLVNIQRTSNLLC